MKHCLSLVLPLLLSACVPGGDPLAGQAAVQVMVRNPLDADRPDAGLVITANDYGFVAPVRVFRQAVAGWQEVPSQFDDLDGDGTPDELFVVLDLGPNEEVALEVRPAQAPPVYESRAHAFLAVQQGGKFENGVYTGDSTFVPVSRLDVPAEQVQGSGFAHREGPVWESDVIGYRYYLDSRALIDVYGKRVYRPLLLDAEGDPHYLLDWGMDVLLVGNSLGLGTPAVSAGEGAGFQRLDNADTQTVEVITSGPLRAILRTTYHRFDAGGRTLDVVSEQEIRAGQRWTEQRLSFTGDTTGLQLVTGMVRHSGAPDLQVDATDRGILYAYTFGPQASLGEQLGLAVLVRQALAPEMLPGDSVNFVLRFRPNGASTSYRYLAAWEREPEAPRDKAAFVAMVHDAAHRWARPVEVERR